MGLIKFLVGLAGLVAICVLSFNYVEEHDSTELKKTLAEYKGELERVSSVSKEATQEKINIEARLKRACVLLKAAEIVNSVCDEPEEKVETPETGAEEIQQAGEQNGFSY